MATITRFALLQALATRLYRNKLDVITGAASSTTSTTSLKDVTRLAYSSRDANAYDRYWVYGEARGFTRVTVGGYAAAGTLALDPALSGLTSGDAYAIMRDHPDVLHEALNEALRNMYVPSFFPLSMHIVQNDANDMESSTLASGPDYTDNTTDTGSLAIESTIVFNGAQSLKVTCDDSTAAEYASLDSSLGVQENQSLYAAVMCYVTSGDSATFRIYDATGSATIEDMTTDEPSWVELISQFSTPSDCEQIDVHMISDAVDDVTYWDDLQIWHARQGVYPCPSWLTRRSQMLDVRAFAQGTTGPSSDNDYRTNERMSGPLDWEVEREDIRGDNPLHLWVEGTGGARPYIYALRPLSELATDAATTTADKDRVVAIAEKLIREPDKASEYLGTLRAAVLTAPRAKSPIRYGVRIG